MKKGPAGYRRIATINNNENDRGALVAVTLAAAAAALFSPGGKTTGRLCYRRPYIYVAGIAARRYRTQVTRSASSAWISGDATAEGRPHQHQERAGAQTGRRLAEK